MNNFKEDLKVKPEYYNKDYIIKKMKNIVIKEIENVDSNKFSLNEKLEQQMVLFRLYKIIDNYDGLEPLLTDYFCKKAKEEKWKERR